MSKLQYGEILQQRLSVEQSKSVRRHPVSVMLLNVRSLYNVGSIFRTCDAALVAELILCGFTPHPPRKEIYKTALGAVDTVPWQYMRDAKEAIEEQRSRGVRIIAVELTSDARNYTELGDGDFPCCLVFGNELTGIDDEILACCDDSVMIPMYGVKHSLNVAVAAGIAIFEAVRNARERALS